MSAETNYNTTDSVKLQGIAVAMDWQSQSTCCIGQRDGQIHLWDIRSQGTSARLQHSIQASAVRALDMNRIVVHGPCSQTALYDLRMTRDEVPRRNFFYPSGFAARSSEPLIRYSGDPPERPVILGVRDCFEVDRQNEMMAVSSDNGLELYSLNDSAPSRQLSFESRNGDMKFYDTGKNLGLLAFQKEGFVGFEWAEEPDQTS